MSPPSEVEVEAMDRLLKEGLPPPCVTCGYPDKIVRAIGDSPAVWVGCPMCGTPVKVMHL